MRRAAGLALAGVALWVIGSGIGEPSLLALAAALVLYAVLATAWLALAARGATLSRHGLPARVSEGEEFGYSVELGGGTLRAPGGTVSDPVAEARARTGPGWRRAGLSASLEGRGSHRLAPAELELCDPLGLATRRLVSEQAEVLVLPRIEPVEAGASRGESGLDAALGAAAAAGGSLEARGIEFEVDGLRPYRPGVPASRIHWPTVARTGEMVERRLAAGDGAAALVVADSSDAAGAAELDMAVRAAASLVHALAPSGGCGLLLSGLNRTLRVGERLEGWEDAHVRLALLGPGPPPAIPRDQAPRVVFWVAARRLHVAPSRGLPTVLVTPFGSGSEPAFRVAGCEGVAAGSRAPSRAVAGGVR